MFFFRFNRYWNDDMDMYRLQEKKVLFLFYQYFCILGCLRFLCVFVFFITGLVPWDRTTLAYGVHLYLFQEQGTWFYVKRYPTKSRPVNKLTNQPS